MRRLLKLLGVLFSLVIVAAGLAAFLFDPNDYKQDVQAGFAAATGRELVIAGQLRVSLLPRPVLEVSQASLPGAPGSGAPALAELRLVRLYPRLLPLLSGRLELALVRVQGLRLRLVRDEQGRANWGVGRVPPGRMGAGWAAIAPVAAWSVRSPGFFDAMAADVPPVAKRFEIDGIEILDSQVTWDDRRSGRQLVLDDLEVVAGPLAVPVPLALRMTGAVRQGDSGAPAQLRVEGQLSFDEGLRRLRLEPLTLELDGASPGDSLTANLSLRTGLAVDLDTRRYLAEEAAIEIQASGAALFDGQIDATARARLELDLGAERLQITGISIRSDTLSLQGGVLGEAIFSAPEFSGDLIVGELDLRAWLERRGLPLPRTADAETFRSLALDAHWRMENRKIGLQGLVLKIDQTALKGDVEQVATDPPGYRFELVADRLDLDRYLPPLGQPQTGPGKVSRWRVPASNPVTLKVGLTEQSAVSSAVKVKTYAAVASAPTPGPKRIPRALESILDLNLKGDLQMRELTLGRLHFGDADFQVLLKGGNLAIDNQVARFYGGRLSGRIGADLRRALPNIALAQKAQEIQIGDLVADFIGEDRLTGRGEITADLTVTGGSMDALRRSLAGELSVQIPRGAVRGVNLERFLLEAAARLRGEEAPKNLPLRTDFSDLRASAKVENGVLSNRDLVANADYLRIAGAGSVDLVQGRVDYRFEPMFVKPPQGRGIKELEGIPIPLRLTGPFSHPRWELDVGGILRGTDESGHGEQGGDLFKKLEERTGVNGLEQQLKGLLGR